MFRRKFTGALLAIALLGGIVNPAAAAQEGRHHHNHHHDRNEQITGGDIVGLALLAGVVAIIGAGNTKRKRDKAVVACSTYIQAMEDGAQVITIDGAKKIDGYWNVIGSALFPSGEDDHVYPFKCSTLRGHVITFDTANGEDYSSG